MKAVARREPEESKPMQVDVKDEAATANNCDLASQYRPLAIAALNAALTMSAKGARAFRAGKATPRARTDSFPIADHTD